VRPDFPAERLALFGPGPGSGTFDYFTAAVIGTESSSRGDYQQNDDGAITARSVAADPSALGYLAFALYRSNAEGLKLVAVDTGQGCVRPSAETAADGSYAPLSRPLFLYVNKAASARAEVGAVVSSYLSPGGSDQIAKLGQVPLPPAVIARERWRFEVGEAGTVLGGHGSVVGLRPAAFEEERDRVRSALVR
jgi:phosphate transport system substrate-binding protein